MMFQNRGKQHHNKASSVETTKIFKKTKSMAMKITYEGEEIANKSYFTMMYMLDTDVTSCHGNLTRAFDSMTEKLTISNSAFFPVSQYSLFRDAAERIRTEDSLARKSKSRHSLKLTIETLQKEVEELRKAIG